MTKASLLENNNNDIDLLLEPIKGGDAIDEKFIRSLIASSEYNDCFVEEANIKNAIAELNSVLKPLQKGQPGREIRYQLLTRKDATVNINISQDEMSAEAEITTAMGGAPMSAQTILDEARRNGVKKGFSKESLIKAAKMAARAESGVIVKAAIAQGKEAINGRDARIKLLVQSAQERILRPKEREDGTVDMRDLGEIICVKEGDPLAKKIPATPGMKGFTVTAKPLDPVPGEDIHISIGNGTAISPKNADVLISTKVGLPKIIENGMEVDDVYQIKNVDVSTGHIDFQGSVLIDGDVGEGMKVVASGDITIGGFVESAILEAGGDITISSGIIGKKQDLESAESDINQFNMTAKVQAQGNIFAKYCQYADITCGGNIRIENQLMHSLITVGGTLWIGTEDAANGKLIGGLINASSTIHAGIVGATAGSKTLINFDAHIASFSARLDDIEQRITVEDEKTKELQAAKNKIKQLPPNPKTKEVLQKVVTTYQFHAKRMGEILSEREQTEKEMLQYMMSVYVEATEKLYQSVEMKIGDFVERTKREYPPSKMIYKERKVIIDPIIN